MNVSLPFLQALILFVWVTLLGIVLGWILRRFFALFQRRTAPRPTVDAVSCSTEVETSSPARSVKDEVVENGSAQGEIDGADRKGAAFERSDPRLPVRLRLTEDRLADMARSASALAMASAANGPPPSLPPLTSDERWRLQVASMPPVEAVEGWPARATDDQGPNATDWRAKRPAHGDYAPSSTEARVFRPLDPAIAGAVLGAQALPDDGQRPAVVSIVPSGTTRDTSPSSDAAAVNEATNAREPLDLPALNTALWRGRAATEGKAAPSLPPSATDEAMRLQIRPRTVEDSPSSDIYASDPASLTASKGAESWRPSKRSEARSEVRPPFRPIGDVDALVRTKWGVSPPSSGTLDKSVTEDSKDDPILNMDHEIPKGRLWGPAVAMPLPSAVAAQALGRSAGSPSHGEVIEDFDSGDPSAFQADGTAFAIGMDDEARPERLAGAVEKLAEESEPAEEDRPVPRIEESEMRRVASEDEALSDDNQASSQSKTVLSPGPSDEDDETSIEDGFEPILRDSHDRGAAPVGSGQPVDGSEWLDMPPPVDRTNEAVPSDPPAGSAHPHGSDDLSRIRGVGPATEQRLHELGVTSYAQIAAWGPDEAAWFGEQLFFPGRVERENWIELARELMNEGSDQG
ncbi:hypothetical protein B7H23_14505 [Notoacmeibacter marinus]|uniref:Uncharacterized protein n=1 Tax=Notoacmeibacter marinus TaxID=1876515 RepID=A0A231UU28_9HYPH|nr:hypothetical protein [Notoacmeibacter marinus]OXS99371.1 hypothetical protein B7H23_14505 [Notoacmeibacter marinus]